MKAQVATEPEEMVCAQRLAEEFERVTAGQGPHFRRREAHEAASSYVKALLSRAERKNAWGLSEEAGKAAPYCFQHLLLRAKWDEAAVRDDVLEYAREQLGEGGVLVVDETGFLKKGGWFNRGHRSGLPNYNCSTNKVRVLAQVLGRGLARQSKGPNGIWPETIPDRSHYAANYLAIRGAPAMMPSMTKKTLPDATPPVISPEEGVARLQELIERGNSLLQRSPTSEEMGAYKTALYGALTDAFGSQSDWKHIALNAGARLVSSRDVIGARHRELRAKNMQLAECVEELKRRAARIPVTAPPAATIALTTVVKILSQFHRVAKHLRNRRDKRPPLKMEDEYDVQYLLHALLLVSFHDVRAEETGPSRAGARPRLDFLLRDERIVIEVKKTRPTLTDKELGDELLADIGRYKGHPDCKTLVCFVYDPDDQIKNAAAIIRDLEDQSSEELQVRVLVIPQH